MSIAKSIQSDEVERSQHSPTKRQKVSDTQEELAPILSEATVECESSSESKKSKTIDLKGKCQKQQSSTGLLKRKKVKATKNIPISLPKKSLTAYAFFIKQKRQELEFSCQPDIEATTVMKRLGREWAQISHHDKQQYIELAIKDKARYNQELKEFQDKVGDAKLLKKIEKHRPKKALSAYMIFVRETRQTFCERNPEMSSLQVMKEVGRAWQSMNTNEREEFELKAKQDKVRFQQQMEAYELELKGIKGLNSELSSEISRKSTNNEASIKHSGKETLGEMVEQTHNSRTIKSKVKKSVQNSRLDRVCSSLDKFPSMMNNSDKSLDKNVSSKAASKKSLNLQENISNHLSDKSEATKGKKCCRSEIQNEMIKTTLECNDTQVCQTPELKPKKFTVESNATDKHPTLDSPHKRKENKEESSYDDSEEEKSPRESDAKHGDSKLQFKMANIIKTQVMPKEEHTEVLKLVDPGEKHDDAYYHSDGSIPASSYQENLENRMYMILQNSEICDPINMMIDGDYMSDDGEDFFYGVSPRYRYTSLLDDKLDYFLQCRYRTNPTLEVQYPCWKQ